MNFRDYIKKEIGNNQTILEFGPLNRPIFSKKENKNIYFADIRDTEEIKKLYTSNEYLKKTGINVDVDTIVDIDYKIIDNYTNTFKKKRFDVVYLSHVVEHIPDIIYFFQDIANIIKEDGKLILIYPDKRYCFDHFRSEVSFRDAYATYKHGLKENARLAFDFSYNVTNENDASFYWAGKNLTSKISKEKYDNAEEYYNLILKNKTLDDIHFWPFSDIGFLKFIYDMMKADLINFEIVEYYPCQKDNQEFMVILKKNISKQKNFNKILSLIDKETEKGDYFEMYNNALIEKEKLIKLNNIQKEKLIKLNNIQKEKYNKILIEFNELSDRFENVELEMKKILSSNSMKITRPFRLLANLIKGKQKK